MVRLLSLVYGGEWVISVKVWQALWMMAANVATWTEQEKSSFPADGRMLGPFVKDVLSFRISTIGWGSSIKMGSW